MNFCSDNVSGIHPRILDALIAGNDGDVMPYGEDPHTRRAEARFREVFERELAVAMMATGTGSNALALSLSVPLPLLDQKQGRIAETIASASQANAQIAALRLSIGNEVASAAAEIKRLQQVMVEYQRTMLPTSERNVGFAQQGYGRGQVAIAEVVQAARQQGELNIAYLNTLNLYLQALAKLRTATAEYLR